MGYHTAVFSHYSVLFCSLKWKALRIHSLRKRFFFYYYYRYPGKCARLCALGRWQAVIYFFPLLVFKTHRCNISSVDEPRSLPVGALCLGVSTQAVNLCPHSRRSAIRDGREVRIPSPATWNGCFSLPLSRRPFSFDWSWKVTPCHQPLRPSLGDTVRVSDATTRVQSRYSGAREEEKKKKMPSKFRCFPTGPAAETYFLNTWRKYPTQLFQTRWCASAGSLVCFFSVQWREDEKVGRVAGRRCAAVGDSGRLLLRSCPSCLDGESAGWLELVGGIAPPCVFEWELKWYSHICWGVDICSKPNSLSRSPSQHTHTHTHTYKEQDSEGFMLDASEMCVPFQEGQPSNIRSNSLCIHLHFSASLSECLGVNGQFRLTTCPIAKILVKRMKVLDLYLPFISQAVVTLWAQCIPELSV